MQQKLCWERTRELEKKKRRRIKDGVVADWLPVRRLFLDGSTKTLIGLDPDEYRRPSMAPESTHSYRRLSHRSVENSFFKNFNDEIRGQRPYTIRNRRVRSLILHRPRFLLSSRERKDEMQEAIQTTLKAIRILQATVGLFELFGWSSVVYVTDTLAPMDPLLPSVRSNPLIL